MTFTSDALRILFINAVSSMRTLLRHTVRWWDRLDGNSERRERDYEKGRSDIPLEWAQTNSTFLTDLPMTRF